ncbi:alkaline phosphatase D family protein [Nocardia donostiensis]|uniref:Alkaline phosphatase n=1 Tax=Nocardia donostiensis TaxID=1538463 RepID=A0A1V2TF16_9NOCA|nr:alkaline phosphatase D family protein [Nocardia donostiensis]ONM48122.1 alkaline phosphatase [Nocardia donostiensis]OQS13890.1 alkaline phosphatase [Nocardia donostiensis]OQS20351.1 alkaline phosphatase [Nocardia donostiensis]
MNLARRQLLRYGAAGSIAVLLGTSVASSRRFRAPRWLGDPFTLGVASGDPTPDGVVLWTRLAPDPFAPDGLGGMAMDPVTVDYEIAHDEQFRRIAARGSAVATRALAHTVHPEVRGLEPGRWYFYRFRAGQAISPVGRTRTAPPPGHQVQRLRFAFASCQAWSSGYFTAYDHLAAEDLDVVVHLGDYIYERGWSRGRQGMTLEPWLYAEAVDLPGYRLRYAQAKAEAPLQAAHAGFPWLVTLDDHEVDNNWVSSQPGHGIDIHLIPALFRRRLAAALQAMYEHQPLRIEQLPSGTTMRLHRRYRFGDLADITMLDTRQYRSPQPCGGNIATDCTDRFSPERTVLGAQQRKWLIDGFARSTARWQIIGNQVAMNQTDYDPGPHTAVGTDAWDGYVAERSLVLGAAAERGVRNLVVITGDRHENYAADLRRDPSDPETPVVAAEFIGTSISTGGNGTDLSSHGRVLLGTNPDLKFCNSQRGYVRVEVDKDLWRSDFRVVPYVDHPGAPVHTRASYVVEDTVPGVTPASQSDRGRADATAGAAAEHHSGTEPIR